MIEITVVGAGLAGCEAAWQLAIRGIKVKLIEMKPHKMTPAHVSADFAELVCSNSLRSNELTNAVGLLKEEMRGLGSLIMECADLTRIEAGGALAVDRTGFSAMVTEKIRSHRNIEIIEREVTEIPDGIVIIATGPLTSDALSKSINELFPSEKYLNFFDAAAPIVTRESIDMESAFFASRYDKGTPDYINCPMTKEVNTKTSTIESSPNRNEKVVMPVEGSPHKMAKAAPKPAPDEAPKTSGEAMGFRNTP